jgi:hypothetical protein
MVALRLRWFDPACSFPIDNSRRNPADNRGTALGHRRRGRKDGIQACRDGMARNPSCFNGLPMKLGYWF